MKTDFENCMTVVNLRKESGIFFSVLEEYFAQVRLDEVGFKDRFDELYSNFKRLKQSSARNFEFFEFKGWVEPDYIHHRHISQNVVEDENNKMFLNVLGV